MNARHATVLALSVSEQKGVRKSNVDYVTLREEWGIEGDAHAGAWHRQISLLATESIEKIRAKGLDVDPGAFAENITTQGIDLLQLRIGDRLTLGAAELEITQKGKECHTRCAIYQQAGDCVMPREGVFARVIHGGIVTVGETIHSSANPGETEGVQNSAS